MEWKPRLKWRLTWPDREDDYKAEHNGGFGRIMKQTSFPALKPWSYTAATETKQLGSGYVDTAREAAREAEKLLLGEAG